MKFHVLLRLIGAGCLCAISGLCIAQTGANNGISVASTTDELKPALAGTASISGQVRLPGGTLRAGIAVSVAWQVDGEWQEAIGHTHDDGSYSVDGLAPASYRVCAGGIDTGVLLQCFDHLDHVSPSGEPAFSAVTLGEGEQRNGVDFDLGGGGSISGQLIDAHASGPLVGYTAVMHVHDSNGELFGASRFTTSASGHYQINGLPDGAFYLVVTSLPNPFVDRSQIYPGIPCETFFCDPLLGQLVTITASGNVDHIDFSFHPDAIVRGKVIDAETGAALDGVTVSGYIPALIPAGAYVRFWSTISHGPDGVYELYLRGYGPTGPYYIVAENAAPHASTAYPRVTCIPILSCLGSAVSLSVQPASTFDNIDISLPLGSAISGVVTDALSGAPLRAYVEILDGTNDRIWGGYTTEDGFYSSDAVPAGTYYAIAKSLLRSQPGCIVYDNRPCPADGMPLSSVDPTPLVLKLGEIRSGINFPIDTNTIFSDSFEP